jgi:NAD-dependent dihydropyrimidine dehydrogenase PreA subunit
MSNAKRVAIIGSGPTGLIAAQRALELDFEVDLIDPWLDPLMPNQTSSQQSKKMGSLAKKAKFGSTAMYGYRSDLIELEDEHHLPVSETIGGLSSVWGANLWFPNFDELGLPDIEKQRYLESQAEVLKRLKMIGSQRLSSLFKLENLAHVPLSERLMNIEMNFSADLSSGYLGSSLLAVNRAACILCGQCLSGCPTNAIFNAASDWEVLLKSNRVNLIKGIAQKINVDRSIQLVDSLDHQPGRCYDKVFIACGAIASTALLQRSGFVPEKLQLKDTQVFYIPFFMNKRNIGNQAPFTLAQLFYRSANMDQGVHISIYESSASIKERISQKVGFLANLVPNFIWNRVLAGIGFVSSDLSGKITLDYKLGKTIVNTLPSPRTTRAIWKILSAEKKSFKGTGLRFFTFGIVVPNVGASYHVGSLIDTEGKFVLNSSGNVPGTTGIYVVDSAALPKLPIGPITLGAMINSHRIVSKALNE